MAIDVVATVRRLERMKGERAIFDTVNQEIADYMMPHKAAITQQVHPGQKTMSRVFKMTPIRALEILAASMHGTLTNPSQKWFSLQPRQKQWRQIEGMQDWLEELADVFYSALGDSNFDAEVVEFYTEAAGLGTAAMFMDEAEPSNFGFGGLTFKTLAFGEYTLGEDRHGLVDTLFREYQEPRRVAHERWGDKMEDRAAEKLRSQPDEMIRFLHVVQPRREYSYRQQHNLAMPFESCYIALGTGTGAVGAGPGTYGGGEPRLLDEGGYRVFPYVTFRWSKMSREVYGRGPGRTALPDVKTLNRLVALNLQALSKEVDPPLLQRHEAIIGGLSLTPASINVVDFDGDLSQAVIPLESKRHADRVMIEVKDLVNDIRECFYANQLELQDKPQMTATEVTVRYEMMQRLLGPVLGRLKYEFLNRLLERGLSLLAEANMLPMMPPEVAQVVQDLDVDVKFEGPLARAQRSHDLVAIERKNQYAVVVGQVKPDIFDLWDFDKEGREVSEITGVPADVVREKSEVEQIRADRAKQQAQQAQAQALMAAAEGIGKAGPGVKALSEAGQAQQGAPA